MTEAGKRFERRNHIGRIQQAIGDLQRHAREFTGYAPPFGCDWIDGPDVPVTCEECAINPATDESKPPRCERCSSK